MSPFIETQRFRQWWLWLLLIAVVIVTASPLWVPNAPNKPTVWIGVGIGLLIMWLFYVWRVEYNSKKKITIGTQRPHELQAFLDARLSLTTT